MGANGEETLLYADDVVVMANSRTDILYMEKGWWHTMNENGIWINAQKDQMEVLVISRNNRHACNMLIGQDKFQQVANYSYLGVNVEEVNLQVVQISKKIPRYRTTVD